MYHKLISRVFPVSHWAADHHCADKWHCGGVRTSPVTASPPHHTLLSHRDNDNESSFTWLSRYFITKISLAVWTALIFLSGCQAVRCKTIYYLDAKSSILIVTKWSITTDTTKRWTEHHSTLSKIIIRSLERRGLKHAGDSSHNYHIAT